MRRDTSKLNLGQLLERLTAISGAPVGHKGIVEVTRILVDSNEVTPVLGFLERLVDALTDGVRIRARLDDGFAGMLAAYSGAGPLSDNSLSDLALLAHAPGHVLVATMHAAKGLEFNHVILVGLDEQVMPGWNATQEEWAEARRLFYVAITRARHSEIGRAHV